MIDISLFIAFVAAALILALTPGLDTAMVLRASLSSHRKTALNAALGIVLGCLAWGVAVSLGLGAILRASEALYVAVKLAGAGYLIYLGFGLLFKPRNQIEAKQRKEALSSVTAFRQGFITNLLNPKIGIFYVSFIPQFIPADSNVAMYSFFLAAVHAALSMLWFLALIIAADRLSKWMNSPRIISRLDRLTGGIFIGFGLKLALSRD
jgi:threonine/homoserine/homoserine lactone efflux protein